MTTLFAIISLVILMVLLFVVAPKFDVFYKYPKKTFVVLIVTTVGLLLLFLIFGLLATR